MKTRPLPTVERLSIAFHFYDEETGKLLRNDGRVAGSPQTKVDGISYVTARVIWKFKTGEDPNPEIDHRNGDNTDNRWVNLREATRSGNTSNRHLPVGRSGIRGVYLSGNGTYSAGIQANGVRVHLIQGATLEEAVAARAAAEDAYHSTFSVKNRE